MDDVIARKVESMATHQVRALKQAALEAQCFQLAAFCLAELAIREGEEIDRLARELQSAS